MLKLTCIVAAFMVAFCSALPEHSLPQVDFRALVRALQNPADAGSQSLLAHFGQVASNIGAFSVHNLVDSAEYKAALSDVQRRTADCFRSHPKKVLTLALTPTVSRSTSATSSLVGANSSHPDCIRKSAARIGATMDMVGELIQDLVAHLIGQDVDHFVDQSGQKQPLSSSQTLDHLHLYQSHSSSDPDQSVAPWHTDNGLFLLVTPSKTAPLLVADRHGRIYSSVRHHDDSHLDDGLIVVLGRGLDDWLLADSRFRGLFRAAPHTVPAMRQSGDRVVVARMYVPPSEATAAFGSSGKPFGEFFMETEDKDVSGEKLCSQKHHQMWRSARDVMCSSDQAYCWMSCLPLDAGCPGEQQQCYSIEMKPCCLEGQSAAEDHCEEHDMSCAWHCPSH